MSVWVAFAGPFGTYEILALPTRIFFWSGLIALGIVLGVFCRLFVIKVLGPGGFWPTALLISSLNAIAFTPPLAVVVTRTLTGSPIKALHWHEMGAFVFVLTFGVAIVRYALENQSAAVKAPFLAPDPVGPHVPAPAPSPEPEPICPRLVQRLGANKRGDLLSISVRDHYVDVRTTVGVDSVLMRFADAILEAEGVDGAQVHRSHWVAWSAVGGVEREGGTIRLRLHNGHLVPVSRANFAKIEQRGLIGPAV